MLILNKNILTIGGNRLEGEPLTPPTPPGPTSDEVTIGTQTWMAKNLAIDDGGEGITIINNNYYYTRDAAKRVADTITGWHLPTYAEWDTLIENGGGFTGLASTNSWTYGGGTNSSGFTALPLGYIPSNGDSVVDEGITARFWPTARRVVITHAEGNNGFAETQVTGGVYTSKHSVRLIKDT